MTIDTQQHANLAEHAYDRKGDMKSLVGKQIELEGVKYKVLEYMDRPSGYQGTIYQRVDTGEIVAAHRGTEFGREPKLDGLIADGNMVANRINPQANDAIELTRHALKFAQDTARDSGGQVPEVTTTGHSLGGTLAQITASKFHLRGEAFNPYGAVSLDYGIPEGGDRFVNHVMAGDAVSAASAHYGQVKVYAKPEEIISLAAVADYANNRSPFDIRSPLKAAVTSGTYGGSHNMDNFINVDGKGRPDQSVLGDPKARALAEKFDPMIDKYRDDIRMMRGGVTRGIEGARELGDRIEDFFRGGGDKAPATPHLKGPSGLYRDLPGQPAPHASGNFPSLSSDPSAFLDQMLKAAQSGDRDTFRQMTQAAAQLEPGQALHGNAMATLDHQQRMTQQLAAQQSSAQQQEQPNPSHGGHAR